MTRNFTLNLGLRYEYDSPATDPTNRMSTFDFATGQIEQVGTNGILALRNACQGRRFRPARGLRLVPLQKHGDSQRLRHLLRLGHVRGQLVALLQSAVLHDFRLLPERNVAHHAGQSLRRFQRLRAAGRAQLHQPEFRAGLRAALEFQYPAGTASRGHALRRLRGIERDGSAAFAGCQSAVSGIVTDCIARALSASTATC